MRIYEVIREDISQYGADWVHFTKHPMLTINPKQMHQDPAGIYFFPASVNPDAEMWRTMPYKFTVNIAPNAKILSTSQLTPEQIYQMIDAAGIRQDFEQYIQQYPPKDMKKMFDMGWEMLQRHYAFGIPGKPRQFAAFNAMLRGIGWQAIFDDTGGIHIGEPQQLLVLDPRIITNVRMEQKSGNGFEFAQKIAQDLATMCQEYGQVAAGPVQRPNRDAGYSEQSNLLMSSVTVTNPQDERNYASFMLRVRKEQPDRVSVSLRYSSPSLGYGSGTEYSISKAAPIWNDGGIEKLRPDLDKIFNRNKPQQQPAPQMHPGAMAMAQQQQPQQPAVAETRKIPGPQLVGSGKDFRQKAGTNRSGKQPGRLAGSGKAMKVRPGFVG